MSTSSVKAKETKWFELLVAFVSRLIKMLILCSCSINLHPFHLSFCLSNLCDPDFLMAFPHLLSERLSPGSALVSAVSQLRMCFARIVSICDFLNESLSCAGLR